MGGDYGWSKSLFIGLKIFAIFAPAAENVGLNVKNIRIKFKIKKMKKSLQALFPVSIILLGMIVLFSTSAIAEDFRYTDSWGKHGFELTQQKSTGVQVNYSITGFSIEDFVLNGESMVNIELPGNLLFNDEGAPNLPGSGRYLAIPEGATAKVTITSSRTESLSNVYLAPAPRIPWETEDGPLDYNKDEAIYTRDAFYPEQPVQLGEVTEIRGVDAVMLGVTPFQYNPVTHELII